MTMKLKKDTVRAKGAELLKVGQFLLMMLGAEMLLIWAACHYLNRWGVRTAMFDQMVFYSIIAGIILLVGMTEIILPAVKQSIKLIGISVIIYIASLIFFTYMPIRLLRHLDLTILYSVMYAVLVIILISIWRVFELSMEKKYAACINKFLQSVDNDAEKH